MSTIRYTRAVFTKKRLKWEKEIVVPCLDVIMIAFFPRNIHWSSLFARKARVNTERVPPRHPIILLKSNKFNMAAVSVKRRDQGARSIQPKFPEISVQNSMDRFGPTGKVSKIQVHLLRWSSFPGRTGLNVGWMDRAQGHFPFSPKFRKFRLEIKWNRPFRFDPNGISGTTFEGQTNQFDKIIVPSTTL